MPAQNKQGTVIQLDKDKPRGKCRKWKLAVSLGKDPLSGKYIRKAKRFTGTYTEAQAALQQYIEELRSNQQSATSPKKSYTYDEFVKLFIGVRKASEDVAPGTVKRDEDKLKSLGFLIGGMDMKDITPLVLSNAYIDLKSGKSKSGKRLSGTYISDIHKKVNIMMKYAKEVGYIKTNPCEAVKPPKQDTKEKRSLQSAKVQELLANLNPAESMECGVLLCTTLGLRRGEAVGLSWGDVDLKKHTVHVCHSYDDAGNLNNPKTKAGNRILPLPPIASSALGQLAEVQIAFFKSYAPDLLVEDDNGVLSGLADDTPVISDHLGNRIHPAGLGHWWYNHRASYGLDGWTLHELRHTFLTLAAEKGIHPSVMQKLAGHSTSRLTMEIYTHVNMDAQREAMDSLQSVFEAS